jgi:folate-binding protein YgfZ
MTEVSEIIALTSRATVSVTGPDWRAFLQGLLTQDVETLAPGQARFAALLTPQGRILFDLFVIGADDGCLLDVAAEPRDDLIQRLKMYRLRAKVEIVASDLQVLASLPDRHHQRDGLWVADPRLASLGLRGYGWVTEAADEPAYHAHRLGLGVPDTADWGSDKAYPIEADFDLLNGIDFKKGCFVGQETTSRMHRRGTIKSRMLAIAFDGPAPAHGAEILAGDLRAGEVLFGLTGRAMALVRLDRIEGASLTVEGRRVAVERPGWFQP